MELEQRVEAFVKLGELLRSYVDEKFDDSRLSSEELEYKNLLSDKINLAKVKNPWFTPDNVNYALNKWSKLLTHSAIKEFNDKYNFKIKKSKKVALITAGN
ncbi:MAG: acyl-CoA reductase, partial [Winogradskyella sp.]|nr:acyl-CoA reductase [Winogradskyella sp.]